MKRNNMVEVDSNDYHDYVIKDGKLIGEFEQMYIKSQVIPWHQDRQENWLDVRLTIELLKSYGPFDLICDFGCGLGYFLNHIAQSCGTVESVLYGYDISETACIKGKSIFPHITFDQFDLMSEDTRENEDIRERERESLGLVYVERHFMVCVSKN